MTLKHSIMAFIIAALCFQGALAQSAKAKVTPPAKSGRGSKKPVQPVAPAVVTPPKVPELTGILRMDRRGIMDHLVVEGDQLKINLQRLRRMQASGDRSVKDFCPAGQEFKEAKIDYAASNERVANAHLSAISAVIGTRWQIVPVNVYGREYNPQYIKLVRTIAEIRAMNEAGNPEPAKLQAALASQKEIVQESHKITEAGMRQLITKMQTIEPPKKSAKIELPFPIRYSCQPATALATPGRDTVTTEDGVE